VTDDYVEPIHYLEPRAKEAIEWLTTNCGLITQPGVRYSRSIKDIVRAGAGNAQVVYRHKDLLLKHGRMWADGTIKLDKDERGDGDKFYSCTAQGMPRLIRGVLFGSICDDLDLVNAQPTIASLLSKKLELSTPTLDLYVAQRKQCFTTFFEEGVSEAHAKIRIIMIMFGKLDVDKYKLSKLGMDFFDDVGHLRSSVARAFPVLRDHIAAQKNKHALSRDVEKSVLSHVLGTVECAIINRAVYLLESKHGRTATSYIFDGANVFRRPGDSPLHTGDAILCDLENEIARCVPFPPELAHWDPDHLLTTTSWGMRFSIKPMEAPSEWLKHLEQCGPLDCTNLPHLTFTRERDACSELLACEPLRFGIIKNETVQVRYLSGLSNLRLDDACKTLILKSQMGTGKSVAIYGQKASSHPALLTNMTSLYKQVVVLTNRRTLAMTVHDLAKSLDLPFFNYQDQKSGRIKDPYVITQVESIYRLSQPRVDGPTLIILDECESILSQLTSAVTHGVNLCNNLYGFERLVRNATHVIFADAFVSNTTLRAVAALREPSTTVFVNNQIQPYDRKAVEILHYSDFTDAVISSLLEGKRVAMVWASVTKLSTFLTMLEEEHPDLYKGTRAYSAQHTAHNGDLEDHKLSAWGDPSVRLICYTMVITVGLSFNPSDPARQFDTIFLQASAASAPPRDIMQALMRVRHVRNNILFLHVERRGGHQGPQGLCANTSLLLDRQSIGAAQGLIKAAPWALDVFAAVSNETNVGRAEYGRLLKTFLERTGHKYCFRDCPPNCKRCKDDTAAQVADVMVPTLLELAVEPDIIHGIKQKVDNLREGGERLTELEWAQLRAREFQQQLSPYSSLEDAEAVWQNTYDTRLHCLASQFYNVIGHSQGIVAVVKREDVQGRLAHQAVRTSLRVAVDLLVEHLQLSVPWGERTLTQAEMEAIGTWLTSPREDGKTAEDIMETALGRASRRKGKMTERAAKDLIVRVLTAYCHPVRTPCPIIHQDARVQVNGIRTRTKTYTINCTYACQLSSLLHTTGEAATAATVGIIVDNDED